jgi:hypothetical protein
MSNPNVTFVRGSESHVRVMAFDDLVYISLVLKELMWNDLAPVHIAPS